LDLAVEDLKKAKHLIDRLPVVRLIQQSIKLRGRRTETTDDLPLGQSCAFDSFLRFERQLIQSEVAEICRILVVFEDVVGVHGALFAGLENVRESVSPELGIHVDVPNGIGGRRPDLELGKRV